MAEQAHFHTMMKPEYPQHRQPVSEPLPPPGTQITDSPELKAD